MIEITYDTIHLAEDVPLHSEVRVRRGQEVVMTALSALGYSPNRDADGYKVFRRDTHSLSMYPAHD